MDNQRHHVYIALGSNLGERFANLAAARKYLAEDIELVACSPVYETPPWGYQDQPAFLNQVVEGYTDLEPFELLDFLKQIEHHMGRHKGILNGPRIIDLDILFVDNLVLESPSLTIPHPRMRGRAFVLLPMADLSKEFIHPHYGLTIAQMLAEADLANIRQYPPTESTSSPDHYNPTG